MKLVLLAFAFWAAPFSLALAEIVYQQPDAATDIRGNAPDLSYRQFFTVSQDTYLDTIITTLEPEFVSGSGQTIVSASIACVDTATATSSFCSGYPQTDVGFYDVSDGLDSDTVSEITLFYSSTTPFLLEAGEIYRLAIGCNLSGAGHDGQNCDTSGTLNFLVAYGVSSPQNCALIAGSFRACDGSPHLIVNGTETAPEGQNTMSRILQQVTPANGATAPTTEVTFQFSWFNSGLELYSVAQTEISDATSGFQYVPLQSNAAVSGNGTTTQTYELEANHLHLWRGCLLNPDTNEKTCSGYFSLNVVGPSASSSFPLLPEVDENNATSTAQGGIFAFLNVPQLMQTRYPFSYFYAIGGLYRELQATSTDAVAAVVLDYENLAISTTTKSALPSSWEVFGTSTVTQYIPTPVLAAWRVLMSSVIWMGFAFFMYRRITGLFHQTTV